MNKPARTTLLMIVMVVAFLVIAASIFGWKTYSDIKGFQGMMASFAPPSVSTYKASYQDWQPEMQAVGSLRAVNGSDLSSELAGIVATIQFDSGAEVAKGTVLVQLHNEDDVAKLQALQATAKLAEINYQRDMKQLKAQAISQAVVDADNATLDSDKAQVAEQQAIVDKKIVRAPFPGQLGVRQVDMGQYLQPGTAIVTLQQLDPIYIDFTMPEQDLPRIQQGQKIVVKTDATDTQGFPGTITAINSRVDPATRNILARATVANPDHKLLPGMFGTVTISVDKPMRYITVPQTSIVFNTYGNTVYLIQQKKPDADGKDGSDASGADQKPQTIAQQSVVITGETRGDQIAVLSGVKDGDEVVTSGQVKLHSGSPVIINNDVQPANDPNPAPQEQ